MSGADVVAVAVVGDANESGSALVIMGLCDAQSPWSAGDDGRYYIALAFIASERRVVSALSITVSFNSVDDIARAHSGTGMVPTPVMI